MGLFSSRPEPPTMPPFVEHHSSPMMPHQYQAQQPYPDMNVIFKGIPKMMQVADDMHRMTNYIADMRNMCFVMTVLSILGILGFGLFKCVQRRTHKLRQQQRRFIQQHQQNIDSEQSSLSRNGITHPGTGSNGHYKQFSRHFNNGDWAHKLTQLEIERNGGGGKGGGTMDGGIGTTSTNTTGTATTVNRHTPPLHNRYGVGPHTSSSSSGAAMIVQPNPLPPQAAHSQAPIPPMMSISQQQRNQMQEQDGYPNGMTGSQHSQHSIISANGSIHQAPPLGLKVSGKTSGSGEKSVKKLAVSSPSGNNSGSNIISNSNGTYGERKNSPVVKQLPEIVH